MRYHPLPRRLSMRFRWAVVQGWLGLPVALLALVLAAGCAMQKRPVQQAALDQILLVGNGAEPSDLDPQLITGIPERDIAATLFEGLVRADPRDLHPVPGVAQSWTVSPDGRTYTFHLRADAKWSNGDPVTAEDFYESFKRILTPALASENADQLYYVAGAEAYHHGRTRDFSQVGFKVLDPLTLQVTLKNPTPFILSLMTGRSWYPLPIAVLRRFGAMTQRGTAWTKPGNLVGNGPFVLTAWKPNQYILVTKSRTYWDRGRVRLQGVKFIPIEEPEAEEAAFRAGELHKTETIPAAKIPVYRREHPELLHLAPLSGVYYYSYNVNRPPFNDVRVRQALAMAVDRVTLVRDVTKAGETPAYNFTPAGVGGYVCRTHVRYDPAAARRLLAEAGYPDGRGFPKVTLLYNTMDSHRIIAEAIQQMWKRTLNIDVELYNQEWKVYLDSMHMQNYQICRAGLTVDPYDPSLFLRTFTTGYGYNDTGWSNPEYDRLLQEAARLPDSRERFAIYQKMEAILLHDMPIIPLYFYTQHYLLQSSVQDWSENLMGILPVQSAWLRD